MLQRQVGPSYPSNLHMHESLVPKAWSETLTLVHAARLKSAMLAS